jgi:VWFA-related protein
MRSSMLARIGAGSATAVLAAAALVTANAQAPVPAQAPSAARVAVHLDVRAEDATGRLMRDLTSSDFRVFENGKRQTLSGVSLVDLPIVRPSPGVQPIARDVASNLNGTPGRSYVLLMGDSMLSEVRRPGVSAAYGTLAREFIEKHLMPGDLAGLVTTPSTSRMSRSLTKDHGALLEAIGRIPSDAHVTENNESLNEKFAAVADYLGGAPGGGRRAIVTFMTMAGSYGGAIDRPSRTLFALRNTTRIDSEPKDWLLELMRATANANVVLYVVDPIGGRNGPISWPLAPAEAKRRVLEDNWRKDFQAEFTGWTGGFAVRGTNADDLAGQFDRIVEDVSAYYFLDYDSSDQKADGKYRELRVEVNRPGVKVRTRLGYVAPGKN